jgi:succinate-semialdehyde dehydrogenase/glutarate-semialdehyde dehydrogenase
LATFGRLQNNGKPVLQQRFIVHDAIYDAFWLYLLKNESRKMGDPTNEEVYYGPMARQDLRDELHGQVLKQ